MKERAHLLERMLSYVLLGGVSISLLAAGLGILLYYAGSTGNPAEGPYGWQIRATNYFAFAAGLLRELGTGATAYRLMALGLVLLLATPYLRVITSFAFFMAIKDTKYVGLTLFVLAVLTWSLLIH
jgi:uncharacterized membrane protein